MPEEMPYAMPTWPVFVCGFNYDHRSGRWVLGDFQLARESPKCWRLFRGINDPGVSITTKCRTPETIAEDLAAKVRELTQTR